MTDWVKKGTIPAADTLYLIAEFLGTTVEYLITGKNADGIPQEIVFIAQKIASLSPNDRQDILDFIDIKLKKHKKGGAKPVETSFVMEAEPVYLPNITIPIREEVKDNVIFHEWGVIEIPLLGSTAAGKPIDFGDLDPTPPTRPWTASLIQGDPENYYCVTVRGESMLEADIKDGDNALLIHNQRPKHGEIMLVRHDNSSTLKRIRITKGKNGQEETWICWEDGSKRKEKLVGEGYEIQGLLVAIERKPGKR
ncbi:MAG: S24 family peptidase [Treponema sp.]|nr:S24 family peptidase [Treponema sp.]